MANIQPAEHHNATPTFDINAALIPRLIVSDRGVGDATEQAARDMRITTAPKHPGRDPVSTHIVDQLVSVLRGADGLALRMAGITNRLRDSAARLEASLHGYQAMDHDAASTVRRIDDRPRP